MYMSMQLGVLAHVEHVGGALDPPETYADHKLVQLVAAVPLSAGSDFTLVAHTHRCPSNTRNRFTKYLTTILRLSYDNAKVTIDLRRTSNLQNILRRTQGFSSVQFTCKIV